MVAGKGLEAKSNAGDGTKCDAASHQDIDKTECLRILKAILDDGSKHNEVLRKKHQEPPKRPRSVNASAFSSNQKLKAGKNVASRTKNTAQFALHEDATIASIPHGQAEQRRYASTTFNSNLKILNAFVKKRQDHRARSAGASSRRQSPSSARTQPLKEINANHSTNPAQDTEKPTCSVLAIDQAAECASAAITVLRKLDHEEAEPNLTSQKRETGALVLLDRLISLELGEKALLEASQIHARYWQSRTQNPRTTVVKSQGAVALILQLFPNKGTVSSAQDFHLISSLQSHLLRLAILYCKQLDFATFVQLTKGDNIEGPAAVVQQALDAQLIDRKEAASHLGSISHALSKVYAAAIHDHTHDSTALHLFDLTFEAQLLRLQSWCYTDQKIQSATDFWTTYHSALRRLWKSPGNKITATSAKYDLSKSSLRRLQQRLGLVGLPRDIPNNTQTLFLDIADVHSDYDEAVELLETLVETSSDCLQLFYKWRYLATLLQKDPVDIPKLQSVFRRVIVDTNCNTSSTCVSDLQMVQTAVTLRKSICTFLDNISKEQHERISSISDIVIQAVDTMMGLLQYMLMCLTHSEDQNQAFTTAVLKTIDSIVGLERLLTSFNLDIIDQYLKVLNVCVGALDALFSTTIPEGEADIASTVGSLAVKVSNVLWRQHSRFSADSDLMRAIKLAEQSVGALGQLPIPSPQGAALGPKLENLAKLHARSGAAHASQIYRRRAAKHYIACGALEEAVERALCCSSGQIWTDSGSLSCQLARCIRTFLDNVPSQVDLGDNLAVILDDETLGTKARFVLLELQILHLICRRAGDGIIVAAREALTLIMGLGLKDEHSAWHARFYSQVLFRATKIKEFDMNTWLPTDTLLRVVQNCEKQTISTLSAWVPCLRSLLCLQIALFDNNSTGSYGSFMAESSSICRYVQDKDDVAGLEAIVDDYECLASTLECVADWAYAMHEDGLRYECLASIHHIHRAQYNASSPRFFRSLVSLLGSAVSVDNREASSSLMIDVCKPDYDDISQQLRLQSLIVQAGYHISRMDFQSCESVLTLSEVAETLAGHDGGISGTKHSFSQDLLLIEALAQSVLLYFYRGMLREACQTSRQAVRLTTLHWTSLESHNNPSAMNNQPNRRYGSYYWKLLRQHTNCLWQMSVISAHQGLYSDAIYYARKLHVLAKALPLEHLLASAEAELALLCARAGGGFQRDRTLNFVEEVTENPETLKDNSMALCLAEASFEDGDIERATEIALKLSNIDSVLRPSACVGGKSTQTDTSPKSTASRRDGPNKTARMCAKRLGTATKTDQAPSQITPAQKSQYLSLRQLEYDDRLQALWYRLSLPSKIETLLCETGKDHDASLVTSVALIHSKLAQATFLYDSTMRIISHDTLTSLLTDSAVSLPAKNSRRRISIIQGFDDQACNNAPYQKQRSGNDGLVNETMRSARKHLKQANDLLKQLREFQVHLCPSYAIHASQKLRSKINLLATSLDLPFSYTPLQVIIEAIEPSGIAANRERYFAFAEHATETTAQVRTWHFRDTSDDTSSLNISHEATELVAQIPSSWQVVSIGLSEGANELHIARVVGGSSLPFMVQLPITRSNEGDGADEYAFAQAKQELDEIIKQANKTAHEESGHDHDNKQRQAWNKQRESLNVRLEAWLTDVDNIWLGGFRGIFSPFQFDEKLTTRFGKAMTRILHKYLPSRRKSSLQDNLVDIHSHVLELFLALGDLNSVDLDNAIMDLLYFVVDILQSSGERNAYDEIDWDNMLVDVLDAVNGFHAKADIAKQQPRHTILILDKELVCFPWENLPCLRDQPISRMPSLNALIHRLQLIRQQSPSSRAFHISKGDHRGAYILNPAGDLTATQSTFEALLTDNDPTSTYNSLVSTAPTESQFTSYLTDSQVLLYFGHGSGAQYIRGRHIRSLCLRGTNINDNNAATIQSSATNNSVAAQEAIPQIATTFLLGCSSAALTTHGKYEPHGPPGWYMLAGAPALVGTLWDVTDRDIDRFAVKTFAEWGLVDAESESVVSALEKSERTRAKRAEKMRLIRGGAKRKTRVGMYQKDKEADNESCGEGVPLDEAVRRAREACLLRWLNGASVVVYGCPVVIDD